MAIQPKTLNVSEYPRALGWAPDGGWLAVGLGDGGLTLVRGDGGSIEGRRKVHDAAILGLAWNPRGAELATSGEDGWLRVWDGISGEKRWEWAWEADWPEHVVWAPDGEHVAVAGGAQVRVWNRGGQLVQLLDRFGSTVSGLVWRPDSRALATSSYGVVQIHALGEEVPTAAMVWKSSFVSIAWSPDGRHLAAGTQENSVIYWKAPFGDGEPLQMSGYASKVKQLAWDHRSRHLSTGGGEVATVWDVSGAGPSGTRPVQLAGHEKRITALAYKPRGDVLVSGGRDGGVYFWNPMAGEQGVKAFSFNAAAEGLAWSVTGDRLAASAADGTLALFL